MNDRKSETPRSDAMNRAWADYMDGPMDSPGPQAPWELCGVLERELTAAHEKIAKVRAETFEECAKECDEWGDASLIQDYRTAAEVCAYRIRALQEKAK